MKKRTIIYNLTSRGLYSELYNLCLAIVYAQHYNWSLELNTLLWNARIRKGWQDYFEPSVRCSNNPLTVQDHVYTKEKPWIGKIYYKPKEFFIFYLRLFLNHTYRLFHPNHIFTKDIFEKMRSKEFVDDILGEDAFNLMAFTFKKMYQLNHCTKETVSQEIKKIKIPEKYIGVHIRRGDKITSKEMQDISLDEYINAIIQKKDISNNVYIATDDISIINEISPRLKFLDFNVYYNHNNNSRGFNESSFNLSNLKTRYYGTINVLLDMEVLIHSQFFIGTYTSNLSRVVPFYLGLEKCLSLDKEWDVIIV